MNDSMKPLKSLRVNKIVIIVLLLILGVSTVLLLKDAYKLTYEKQKQQLQGGTMSWLQALCDKDYSLCDMYIASDGFKITGFERTAQAIDNPVSSKVYYQFLDFAVDSIRSIKVLNISEDTNTGYTNY